MNFFKINIIIVLFILMGCSNAISQEFKENKNTITVQAKNYKVKLKSCSLEIPLRYELIDFSHREPTYIDKQVYPNKNFSYQAISFVHKEVNNQNWSTFKNFILEHKIEIANKKFLDIDVFSSKLQFISSKKFSDIHVLRYKYKKLKNIDRTDVRQFNNEKLNKLNNILIVNETGFSIIINETDEYIDEIYTMLEDCASQMDTKEKK